MSRIALVTGGIKGIGAAVAIDLKAAGYLVAVTFQGDIKEAEKFTQETGIPHFKWNVGDYDECVEGVKKVVDIMGPIDVLVNNAGITKDQMMHKMSYEDWFAVINVNLTSAFNMTKQVLEGMRERRFGRIINMSSINAQRGQMGQTNYCASKAGMIGFTKALSKEVASKNITVNAVAPGYIETAMVSAVPDEIINTIVSQIPMGRLGRAHEISKIVTFLASDSASYITGSTISANGGMYSAS